MTEPNFKYGTYLQHLIHSVRDVLVQSPYTSPPEQQIAPALKDTTLMSPSSSNT